MAAKPSGPIVLAVADSCLLHVNPSPTHEASPLSGRHYAMIDTKLTKPLAFSGKGHPRTRMHKLPYTSITLACPLITIPHPIYHVTYVSKGTIGDHFLTQVRHADGHISTNSPQGRCI